MTIGERIKEVRKNEKLTQQEFADRLNLKRNTVGSYEVNVVEPSDRTIKDICDKFGVREEWLRTGEGEMMAADTQSDKIAAFLGDLTRMTMAISEGALSRCWPTSAPPIGSCWNAWPKN